MEVTKKRTWNDADVASIRVVILQLLDISAGLDHVGTKCGLWLQATHLLLLVGAQVLAVYIPRPARMVYHV
jgi:hypothetical protein